MPKLAGPQVAISRFTALYLDGHQPGSGAATRIVPLRSLLGQRGWPDRGRRSAGELHQLCIGFGSLDLAGQATLLDRILTVFDP